MKILGIETSCDETAAAVVEFAGQRRLRLLSNVVQSSMDLHVAFGGVVPEIAARSHIESITPVIKEALSQAECTWSDIDGIAVTYGAGLGGSLLVGVLTARTLAIIKKKPLYAVNHVEGHIYANFITSTSLPGYKLRQAQPEFPMLGLIVSGGHSQLVLWRNHFDYTLLGQTHDDAIGEAYDKVAKILGLPYPGGPSIEKKAKEGDPFKYELPKAKISTRPARVNNSDEVQGGSENSKGGIQSGTPTAGRSDNAAIRAVVDSGKYDFSFSGVKTAVLRLAQKEIGADYQFPSYKLSERLSEPQKADIAASFCRVATETVVDKTIMAIDEFKPKSIVIGGGVAASRELRKQLSERSPLPIEYTDMRLCTDNGAMIAALGCFQAKYEINRADPFSLEIAPSLSM